MGVLDFAEALVGRRPTESKPVKAQRRTRLSEAQKNSLKGIIVSVLSSARDGMSRSEIAENINNDLLSNVGVDRTELANKLRQPLAELVGDSAGLSNIRLRVPSCLAAGSPDADTS